MALSVTPNLPVIAPTPAAGGATSSVVLQPGTVVNAEVLKLLARGLRNRDIGRVLCISERTVGNHTASVYSKLGVADRAEAIVHAIKAGLVSL